MRIIHEFVDKEGRTQFDEFESSIPFDMGDIPQTAYVLLMLRSNARRIAELWKECDDGVGNKKLYIGCPYPGLPEIGQWEEAKTRVRELCFDNPAAIHGGIRAAKKCDYASCRTVALSHDIHVKISQAMAELPADKRTQFNMLKTTYQVFGESDQGQLVSTISAHPLWKRLSWIDGINPMSVFNLVGMIVDPTWYVHPEDPSFIGLFKERCGLFDAVQAMRGESVYSDVFAQLVSPLLSFFKTTREINLNELNAPKFFFLRYAFKWMEHYVSNGESEQQAFAGGMWRYVSKLTAYIWLSWMESIHPYVPVNLEEQRFFLGDKAAATASYKAAVS